MRGARHRDQAELSRPARDRALREIQARVDRKVSLLLPTHLNPNSKQIDHLDKHHFQGRSFAPTPEETAEVETRTPFGAPIQPAKPPSKRKEQMRDNGPANRPEASWRIEDE